MKGPRTIAVPVLVAAQPVGSVSPACSSGADEAGRTLLEPRQSPATTFLQLQGIVA